MIGRLIIILICILSIINITFAKEPKWFSKMKQIIPIQSNKQDVEKLFGKPKSSSGSFAKYNTKNGILTIEYSTGLCESTFYAVEKGIVVDLNFRLNKEVNFSKLKLDLSKFEKQYSDDTENVSFKSLKLGMSFGTYIKYIEEIEYDKRPLILRRVTIFPSSNYDHLQCPRIKIN